MRVFRSYAARAACKGLELCWRGATWLREPFAPDPTTLLTERETPAQKAATTELKAAEKAWAQKEHERGVLGDAAPYANVLVVVPFRDVWALTEKCLASLATQDTTGLAVTVLLVDNGSTERATEEGIRHYLETKSREATGLVFETLRIDLPFNYSQLNNEGVKARPGADWLVFLNNDVELTDPQTLRALVGFARKLPHCGAVGTTLLYPDGRIQHLFVAPGVKIVAAHPYKGRVLDERCAWWRSPHPVAAVTGALMLVPRAAFEAVKGFDENLPTLGQDVDLCLKLQQDRRVNWVLPLVKAVHHEGSSKGFGFDKSQVRRLYERWGGFLTKNPYYHPSFSRFSEMPAVAPSFEPPYPWASVLP